MSFHDKMNEYLANQQVSFIKLHNLHWYVTGNGFFTLHEKFESLYNQTAQIIDEVAERMLANGHMPVASIKKSLNLSRIKELDDKYITCDEAIKVLRNDIEFWINDSAEIAKLAEEEGDAITADMFRGYMKEYQKTLWMLRSYQK